MTGRVLKVGNSRPLMATVVLSTGELNEYKRNLNFNPSRKSENWYRPGGRREKRKLYERRDRRKRIDIGSKGIVPGRRFGRGGSVSCWPVRRGLRYASLSSPRGAASSCDAPIRARH